MFGKNKPEKIKNQFNLDASLDMDDFNFDELEMKDDRKPITKFASGVKSGAIDGLKDTNFLKKAVKDILPDGFGKTLDLTDEVARHARSLYDDTEKEIKPVLKDFKRITTKLIPKDSKYVPKAVQKLLKEWEEQGKNAYAEQSKDAQRENFLAMQMADTFKAQLESDGKNRAEDQARDNLKQGLELNRHRDIFGILNQTHQQISRLSQYETTVGLQISKKNIELQYRQLFALQDILTQTRENTALWRDGLITLTKNTALPDFLKINSKEYREQLFKNKFNESLQRGLYGGRDEFIKNVFTNARNVVLGKVKNAADSFKMGLSGVEEIGDSVRMAADMGKDGGGPSVHEMAGGFAGSLASQSVAMRAGKWAKTRFLDRNQKFNKLAQNLNYLHGNIPQKLNTFRNSHYGENNDESTTTGKLKNWFFNTVKQFIPGQSVDNTTDVSSMADMNKPYSYTRKADKSLTEIIPGYLSRILREVRIFRTGDATTELLEYNYDKNSFSKQSEFDKYVKNSIVNATSVRNTQDNLDELLKELDPENKLSPEAKAEIKKKLLSNSTRGKEATLANLSRHDENGTAASVYKNELIPMLDKYFKSTENDMDKRNKMTQTHNAIAGNIHDPRARVQDYINSGQGASLQRLGFLDESGKNFNIEKLLEQHLDGLPDLAGHRAKGGKTKRRKKYLVGEKGPEILQMGEEDGNVIPNDKLGSDPLDRYKAIIDIVTKQTDKIVSAIEDSNTRLDEISDLTKAGLSISISTGKFNFTGNIPGLKSLKNLKGLTTDKLSSIFGKAKKTKAGQSIEEKLLEILEGYKNSQTSKTGMQFDNSIPGFISHMAYSGSEMIGKGAGMLKKGFKANYKLGSKHLNALKNKALSWWDDEIYDIFVEGDPVVRMKADDIRNGKFVNAVSGKVIKVPKDITGPVLDNTGKEILSAADLLNMYIYNPKTRSLRAYKLSKGILINAFNATKKFALNQGVDLFNKQLDILKTAKSAVMGTFRTAMNVGLEFIDPAIDVYLKGQLDKPILLGKIMRAGGYYSKMTGKIITRPGMIDGPVLDQDKQTVLSIDDLKVGLVDVDGNPLKTPLDKLKNLLTAGLKKGMDVAQWGLGVTKRIVNRVTGGLKGMFGDFSFEINSKKTVSVLEEIRNILLDRLPAKKKIFGDIDGDGIREGSWQDEYAKDAKEREKEKESKKSDKAKGGKGAMGAAMGAGLFDGLTNIIDGIGNALSGLGDLKGLFSKGGAKAAGTAAGGIAGTAKKAGIGGKMLGMGKSLGKGLLSVGKFGLMALPWVAMLGLQTAGAVVGGTVSAGIGLAGILGSTLAAIGGGLLAFVSSPIVLGAAAIALTSYGLYKGYKYFTKGNATPLQKIRYVQYGFKIENPDYASKVFEFENYVAKFTKADAGGALISDDKMTPEDMMKPFGLYHSDDAQLRSFFSWYQNRFKPVYLTHVTALKAINKSIDLSTASSLEDVDKKAYIEATRFPEGPYNYDYLPVTNANIKDDNLVCSNGSDVKAIIEAVITELKLEKVSKDTPRKKTSMYGSTPLRAGVNSQINKLSPEEVAKLSSMKKSDFYGRSSDTRGKLTTPSLVNTTTVASDTATSLVQIKGRIEALDAVRFKAYGLVDMDTAKVRSIMVLETETMKLMKYQNETNASWQGDPTQVLTDVCGSFGVAGIYGLDARDWLTWFKNRFLPVFTTYISGFRNVTGKDYSSIGLIALKPTQILDIANLIAGRSGVWNQTESPWPDYELNIDSSTTKENIAALEAGVKQDAIDQQKLAIANKNKSVVTDIQKAQAAMTPPVTGNAVAAPLGKSNIEVGATPDAEAKPSTVSGGKPLVNAPSSPSGLNMASGELKDGRGAMSYVKLGSNVTLKDLNPMMAKNFYGMAEEYGTLTGKSVPVTSGFRSYQHQADLYAKNPSKTAKPGTSMHEYGLAMDIDPKTLDEMDKMGLMKKYGFTRPVSGEPWHMEPAGIQSDVSTFKTSPNAAADAIAAGLGRGGGGYGTVAGATGLTRNRDLAMKLYNLPVIPNTDNKVATGSDTAPAVGGTTTVKANATLAGTGSSIVPVTPGFNVTKVPPTGIVSNTAAPRTGLGAQAMDAEIRPEKVASKDVLIKPTSAANPNIAGMLADGGKAQRNKSYIVGEDGPERLDMGDKDGTVVPNYKTIVAKTMEALNNNPLSSAYGFNKNNPATRDQAAAQAMISPDLMKNTEGLLTQSLEVETKILNAITIIKDYLLNKDTKTAAPAAKKDPYSYTPPTPPVPMKSSY